MTANSDWPSTACFELFRWLRGWGVPPLLVPTHLRSSLESDGHEAITRTSGCEIDPECAYSHLPSSLRRAMATTDDYFVSSGHDSGYSTMWGFGVHAGDIVAFVQTTSASIGDGWQPDVRPYQLFEQFLGDEVDEPSEFDIPSAVVIYSSFRGGRAELTVPDDTPLFAALGAAGDQAAYERVAAKRRTKREAVIAYVDAVNGL